MSNTNPESRFRDLELRAEVWLASEQIPLERLLSLEPGGTLQLSRDPDGPVDLVVNGTVVASGELVVVDGYFGFRVTESSQRNLAELDGGNPRAAAGEAEATEAKPKPAARKRSTKKG